MRTFKAALLGATFLVGATAAADAADIYKRGGSMKDTPADYMPAITWAGFYVGAHVGAAFNNDDSFFSYEGFRYDASNDDTTWLAGVQVGYNWQRPDGLVLGVEGDVSFADNVDYLATIRGRIGYAVGQTLVYATGGAAFVGLSDNHHFEDLSFKVDDSDTGWVAGLGFEYKLRQNVSIGLEGLYYNFGNGGDHYLGDGLSFHEDDADFWVVRARLNYHFTGPY
jgi:outer membrane immunogenic protein